jgi:hypothetical protein
MDDVTAVTAGEVTVTERAARQIDRSVPVGMSPRWFGTGMLS